MNEIINFRPPVDFRGIPAVIFNRHKNEQFGGFLNWHREIEITYLRTGTCKIFINGSTYTLWPGDIAVANSNELHHRIWFYGDCYFTVMQLDPAYFVYNDSPELAASDLGRLNSFDRAFETVIRDEELARLFDRVTESWAAAKKDPLLGLSVIADTCGFYAHLVRNHCRDRVDPPGQSSAARYISHTLDYINTHFAKEIYVGAIAGELYISDTYLSSLFKKGTGISISTYINEVRCQSASALLQKGASVTEAAFASGFNDPAYFSRIFKKMRGISPARYQIEHAEGKSPRGS